MFECTGPANLEFSFVALLLFFILCVLVFESSLPGSMKYARLLFTRILEAETFWRQRERDEEFASVCHTKAQKLRRRRPLMQTPDTQANGNESDTHPTPSAFASARMEALFQQALGVLDALPSGIELTA